MVEVKMIQFAQLNINYKPMKKPRVNKTFKLSEEEYKNLESVAKKFGVKSKGKALRRMLNYHCN